jgi:hypothetical protein
MDKLQVRSAVFNSSALVVARVAFSLAFVAYLSDSLNCRLGSVASAPGWRK